MGKNRREFLKAAAAGMASPHIASALGLSPLLLAQRLLANPATDSAAKFVIIRVHRAMDSTLGLHPHLQSIAGIDPKDLFLGYDPLTEPLRNIAGTQISLGPAAKAIAPFARNMALLRGVIVGPSDLGHPFAIHHMATGRTENTAPGWAGYLGQILAGRQQYVVTNATLERGDLPAIPTLLTSVLRSEAASLSKAVTPGLLGLHKKAAQGVRGFLELQAESAKLKRFTEIYEKSIIPGQEVADSDLMLASLYSGLSRVAQWDIPVLPGVPEMDTHALHGRDHLPAQTARWELIAKFLSGLQELDLLKDTLVVVVTEFNRTPGLNANDGKDHNYTDNAVALFGRGVNGGSVIGDRHLYTRADGFDIAYWAGSYINFSEGRDLIRPGDLWTSVADSFGAKALAKAPRGMKVIPGLFT